MGDAGDRESRTIFARNIAYSATEDDFRQIPDLANAVEIKLPTDRETGRPRGFGFIEFQTAEECKAALANIEQQGGCEIHGRQVFLAQSQPRGGGGGGGYGGGQGGGYGGGYQQGGGGYGGGGYDQ